MPYNKGLIGIFFSSEHMYYRLEEDLAGINTW